VRELAGPKGTDGSGVSAAISGAVAAEADNPKSRLRNMAFGIAAGALTAIVSQIAIYEYRLWRDKKEEERKKAALPATEVPQA
jgi:uncharacterized membrane protein